MFFIQQHFTEIAFELGFKEGGHRRNSDGPLQFPAAGKAIDRAARHFKKNSKRHQIWKNQMEKPNKVDIGEGKKYKDYKEYRKASYKYDTLLRKA